MVSGRVDVEVEVEVEVRGSRHDVNHVEID